MVYQIKYDDIMSVGAFTNSTSKAYSDQLEAISKSISPIISMNQLKGQAADSVKTYLAEVHGNILGSIGQIIQEYQVRFLLYKDGYFQEIDNDLHAQLDEKVFDELISFFKSSKSAFEVEEVNLDSTIGTINDILATKISAQNVLQSYEDASKRVGELRTKTGEYETKHKNEDLVNFKNMLQALKLLIADYQGKNSNVVTQYEAGSIATANGAQDLGAALQASATGMEASQSQIKAAGGREEARWKAYEKELADARKEKGIWNAVFAVGAIVIGGAAIVLTAGAATPLVVTATVAGTASMAYGASNLVEAGQDIYYGATGDGFSMAINPLRDTIFMGNQQAYDIFGTVATTAAGLCIPVGVGLKAAETTAKTAGTAVTKKLVAQAVAKELGKEAITGAVAGGTGYATNWAANEFLPQFVGEDAARNIGIGGSLLTGLTAGWGAYKGLSNMSAFQVKAGTIITEDLSNVARFSERTGEATGTVWDDIKGTQPPREGTTIPKSFEINVNGGKLWVNPNGTKHMIEYSTRNLSHGQKLTEQQLLRSFQGAVEQATSTGINFDTKIMIDNWELIFSPAREAGQLPVVKHAVYLP
ncbi:MULTISPECIES: T7SS effector LXG polymorphic toxin [Listeria]|uniref:T7SS effector LXG polymorphic toxin n=1 Tax=Listeria TaxID=1637 RepID=UPI000B597E2B|nr:MULTISPECIES: T7SS effector LXG polymorphic toxin [Listeria]